MKKFTRIEPTTIQEIGERFKNQAVVKRFQTEDGLTHEFTTFNREGESSVAVVALTKDHQVIIARQFRPGREFYCDDIPGGGVYGDESLETAAHRELSEETGYQPGSLSYLGAYSWDAYRNFTSHYFLALDCELAGDPNRDQVEADQGMETVLIPIGQFLENARRDKVVDIAAVFLAYDKLKAIEEGEKS